MGSSLNKGPLLGPQHSTAPLVKGTPKRDPLLENYPYVKTGPRLCLAVRLHQESLASPRETSSELVKASGVQASRV